MGTEKGKGSKLKSFSMKCTHGGFRIAGVAFQTAIITALTRV